MMQILIKEKVNDIASTRAIGISSLEFVKSRQKGPKLTQPLAVTWQACVDKPDKKRGRYT